MIKFKQIVTESFGTYTPLSSHPDALGIHIKYHEKGIPLPDRDDLHYDSLIGTSVVMHNNPDGGKSEYNYGSAKVYHKDATNKIHKLNGPALIDGANHYYYKHGELLGYKRIFKNGDVTQHAHIDGMLFPVSKNELKTYLTKHGVTYD